MELVGRERRLSTNFSPSSPPESVVLRVWKGSSMEPMVWQKIDSDPYGRMDWLIQMGLRLPLIRRNRLLELPEEGFKIMLHRVLSERGVNGRKKGFKVKKDE
jgi:hypothetical protein